jgi:hypothetical protein
MKKSKDKRSERGIAIDANLQTRMQRLGVFNRRTSEDLRKRAPGSVSVDTLSSKGYSVLTKRHERGANPSVEQQKANRKKTPKRRDYGHGIHVEYSPGNAAYFVMWHHEVLSIRPTWEAADEHARSLIANKSKDTGGECGVAPSTKAVSVKRTQSGEPPVVEHYDSISEAVGQMKLWMSRNPPGEHGHVLIESREKGSHGVRTFKAVKKNEFEWKWST